MKVQTWKEKLEPYKKVFLWAGWVAIVWSAIRTSTNGSLVNLTATSYVAFWLYIVFDYLCMFWYLYFLMYYFLKARQKSTGLIISSILVLLLLIVNVFTFYSLDNQGLNEARFIILVFAFYALISIIIKLPKLPAKAQNDKDS